MSLLPFDPIPNYDPMVEPDRFINGSWYRWLEALVNRVLNATQEVSAVHRAGLSAAITTTTVYTPTGPETVRVSWSLQVTTAAGVSSSVQMTLGWKVNTVAQTKTFTALTGNTTTSNDSDSILIAPDHGTPVTYATAYASNPAGAMVYTVDVTVERVTER